MCLALALSLVSRPFGPLCQAVSAENKRTFSMEKNEQTAGTECTWDFRCLFCSQVDKGPRSQPLSIDRLKKEESLRQHYGKGQKKKQEAYPRAAKAAGSKRRRAHHVSVLDD